jgi:hypothetical protein
MFAINRHHDEWGKQSSKEMTETVRIVFRKPCLLFTPIYIGIVGSGVQLGPLCTAATDRLIVPAPGDYVDGEIGGIIGRRNQSTRRKPAPVPLCSPQTPDAGRKRTRAAAVGSQRLTTWASIFLSIYLWIYSPWDLGRFFSFLIYKQSVGLLGRGISPSQGRTYTQKNINTE